MKESTKIVTVGLVLIVCLGLLVYIPYNQCEKLDNEVAKSACYNHFAVAAAIGMGVGIALGSRSVRR